MPCVLGTLLLGGTSKNNLILRVFEQNRGGETKKIRVKFLFNTADFGPVFSYWRRKQSKKCPQSHAAFFSHEVGAQKSARLRTEPPFSPQKWPVWGFYICRVGGKRRKKGHTGSKETPMSVELPCHLAGLEEKGEKAEKEKKYAHGESNPRPLGGSFL